MYSCEKAFTTSGDLHIHTEEKTFSCSVSDKKMFSVKYDKPGIRHDDRHEHDEAKKVMTEEQRQNDEVKTEVKMETEANKVMTEDPSQNDEVKTEVKIESDHEELMCTCHCESPGCATHGPPIMRFKLRRQN